MRIEQKRTYRIGEYAIEVELRIAGDHAVEVDDIFGVRGSDGEYIDVSLAAASDIQDEVNDILEAESDAGEWDEVIDDTRLAAEVEGPETVWGHGFWAPKEHIVPGAFRVH